MGLRGPGSAGKKKAKDAVSATPQGPQPWEKEGLTRAERVIVFLETLPITAGPLAGQNMKVRKWQREIIEAIYRTDKDGRRIIRQAVITIPRGNGKTGLAAGLCLAHMLGPEAESRGQCISAATDRNQAALLFNEMEAIIQRIPWMEARVNIQRFHKKMEDTVNGSVYLAMSADARKAHGLSPSFYVYDELAQAPNSHLLDNIESGTGKRAEPLGIIISTQSADPLHTMSKLVDYGLQARNGIISAPNFHLTYYAAPEDADIFDEKVWFACNPALGDFRDIEEFRQYAEKVKRIPGLEPVFRNLYLNQRVDIAESFIPAREWDACGLPINLGALKGRKCYAGLDLSSVSDLTALVLIFPDETGVFDVLPFFWCPKDNLRAREDKDRVPYVQWADMGLIEPTPGAAVDFAFPAHKLGELAGIYDIQGVAFDRYKIREFNRELAERGIVVPMQEWGQGFKDMGFSIDALERLVLNRQLRHGGNPLLRWNISNVVIVKDPAGSRKFDKAKAREKIDGAQALAMAVGLAKRQEKQELPACLLPLFAGLD